MTLWVGFVILLFEPWMLRFRRGDLEPGAPVIRSLLQLLSIGCSIAAPFPVFAQTDCNKNLASSALLRADVQKVGSVPERFMAFFTSETQDVFPGARVQIRLKTPLSSIDLDCLDQHVPLVFIDGYKFPHQPIRYLPADAVERQHHEREAGTAAGGTSLAAAGARDKALFDTVEFQLQNVEESKQIWQKLHKSPRPERRVEVGIGFQVAAEGVPAGVELRRLKTDAQPMRGGFAPSGAYPAAWISFFALLAAAVILGYWKRGLFSEPKSGELSQGTTQAFAWFVLVIALAVHLWLLTGAMPALSPNLLALMGVSGGTLVVAVQMNQKGLPTDDTSIVESGIPALQAGLANAFVMLTFVIQSHEALTLAAIDPTWIGVLAISNGVFLVANPSKIH